MIDIFASAPWYVDHLAPIWLALPPELRGRFIVSARAQPATVGLPNVILGRIAGDDRPILTSSYGDYRAAVMAGRTRIALGQHGAGQSYSTDHRAYPGGRDQGSASLFLVPNDHAARLTRAAYPRSRVELVGCPKLDTLPRKPRNGQPVIAFSFHWDGPAIAPEMRSAWPYYERAVALASRHRHVIGHGHPRAIHMLSRAYRRARIEVVPSFADVLRRADLYACDNSSSLFEFAATGRPVLVLNQPAFRREVRHGLRFWDAAGVGINVDHPGELMAAIDRAIDDPPEVRAAREAALDLVYRPRSGGAAIAAAALVDWAGVQPLRPSRPRRVR